MFYDIGDPNYLFGDAISEWLMFKQLGSFNTVSFPVYKLTWGLVHWNIVQNIEIFCKRNEEFDKVMVLWTCDHFLVLAIIRTLVLVLILNPLLDFFLVYQADVSIFYTSNLYWWGKGWPVDGLPFPDTGCPVPDVSIYYMSNINELPDGILFHWFCKCTPPWMFLPLDIPSEYRPEHVTFGLLCVIFKFPSRIFCRRVPGFATDCPCGVWCRGLTTCLLYVGPPLEF